MLQPDRFGEIKKSVRGQKDALHGCHIRPAKMLDRAALRIAAIAAVMLIFFQAMIGRL